MDTALDDIRKKPEAHAQQQYLIVEQHYRTLRGKRRIDDVINLGALLRSQGRTKEGSSFIRNGSISLNPTSGYY